MKKQFFIAAALTAAFTTTLINNSSTFATGFYEEKKYWTFDEMIALEKEARPKILSFCSDEVECQMMMPDSLREWIYENEEHQAIWNFESYDFVISGFNPSKNTIKIYYNPLFSEAQIKDLLVVWFNGVEDFEFATSIRNEAITDTTQILLNKTEDTDAPGWLPNAKEVEFTMETPLVLSQNFYNQIFWDYRSNHQAGGIFVYPDCVNSPDYHDGMECRAMINGERLFYLPVEPTVITNTEPDTPSSTEDITNTEPDAPSSTEDITSAESDMPLPGEDTAGAEFGTPLPIENTDNADLITPSVTEGVANTISTTGIATADITDVATIGTAATNTIDIFPVSTPIATDISTSTSTAVDALAVTSAESPTVFPTEPEKYTNVDIPTAAKNSSKIKDNSLWLIILLILACNGILLWFFLPKAKKSKNNKDSLKDF